MPTGKSGGDILLIGGVSSKMTLTCRKKKKTNKDKHQGLNHICIFENVHEINNMYNQYKFSQLINTQ